MPVEIISISTKYGTGLGSNSRPLDLQSGMYFGFEKLNYKQPRANNKSYKSNLNAKVKNIIVSVCLNNFYSDNLHVDKYIQC